MTTASSTQPTLISAIWPAGSATPAMRWIVLMIAGSTLLALSSQVAVPLNPVPITMQTFAVLVIGAAYGWRLGAATVALYLAEGAIGLPVFAELSSGPAALFGPTGGYLFGFLLAAAIAGFLAERGWDRDIPRTALAMLAGNIALYAPGLIWLSGFVGGFDNAVAFGLMPFLGGDLLKLGLAACLMPLTWELLGRPHD
jgi:biotin transport system substrate-specific component